MKIKIVLFAVFVVLVSSCKREYTASFGAAHQNKINKNSISADVLPTEEVVVSIQSKPSLINSVKENPTIYMVSENSKTVDKPENSTIKSPLVVKKEVKKIAKVNKDRDPRYSRALIMTIMGGLVVGLGILANSVAPTGLIVFVFGIIFLIGVVSLISYWANPRPKM